MDPKLFRSGMPFPFEEEESNEFWVTEFNDEQAMRFQRKVFDSLKENPFKPFIIKINSPGGEVHALLSMLDVMKAAKEMAPERFGFITIATGKAFSAAAVLLSAGDVRLATANTSIMIHQVIGGAWGSHPENQIEFAEIDRLNEQLLTVLRKNCKLKKTTKDLEALLKHNVYLNPAEAVAFGLIDNIGYAVLAEHRVYEIEVFGNESATTQPRRADRKTPKTKSKSKPVSQAPAKPKAGKRAKQSGTPSTGERAPQTSE